MRIAPLLPLALFAALLAAPAAHGQDDGTDREAAIREAVEALDGLGTTWRVRDVIRDLDARYGTFADLDGDGDEDYVATEMLHGEERLTTYLREEGGWRRVARFGKEMQNRHPQRPWVIPDGGRGHPAIVVPTGWAPYFFVFDTDGEGGPDGPPQHLMSALPERLSKSLGVDNNPYTLTEVQSASRGKPAILVGTLDDSADEGDATVQKEWHIALRPDRPRLVRVNGLREPPVRLAEGTIPDSLPPPAGRGACDHASPRRRAPALPRAMDVDRDGTLDLVVIGADFAAHVFPGKEQGGRLSFGDEPAPARPIRADDARRWLAIPEKPDTDWASAARMSFFIQDFTLRTDVSPEVALHLADLYGNLHVATWFWTGRAMVPVYRARELWPQETDESGDPVRGGRETVWWRDAWRDVTSDGVPDALSVGVARVARFEGPPGRRRKVYLHDGAQRAGIVFREGESGVRDARWVALLDVDVECPEDVHRGLPIDLEPVRVEGRPDADVRCIYIRPWKVGIFVEHEPSRAPEADEVRRRRASVWLRRGDEILDDLHALDACDEGLCGRGLRLSEERTRDALFCFEQAAGLTLDADGRRRAAVGIARCREALGELGDPGPPPRTWEAVDAKAARRIAAAARSAGRDGQEATERRLLQRALELAPDLSSARLRLGWKRSGGEWTRDVETATEVENRYDLSHPDAARFRDRAQEAETWRADRLLELALEDDALVPDERALLLGVLRRAPHHDGIHEALGHTWTGGGWARPELLPAAQRLTELETRWRELSTLEVPVTGAESTEVQGHPVLFPTYTAGGVEHILGLETRDTQEADTLGRDLAALPTRVGLFLEGLVGDSLRPWKQRRVWLASDDGYREAIDVLIEDPAQRRGRRASSTLDLPGLVVMECDSPRLAHDLYAHVIGFRTAYYGLGWLDVEQGAARFEAHDWFKEALGFAASLELFDSADTWYFSSSETSRKTRDPYQPPAPRDRAACLRYVREALMDGNAPSLRQVFGRSLNNLGLLASLEGWTFLRFAAAYDPEGLRRLPAELRAAREGSFEQRSVRAVERAFDTDIATLERLWRTFTLETR